MLLLMMLECVYFCMIAAGSSRRVAALRAYTLQREIAGLQDKARLQGRRTIRHYDGLLDFLTLGGPRREMTPVV